MDIGSDRLCKLGLGYCLITDRCNALVQHILKNLYWLHTAILRPRGDIISLYPATRSSHVGHNRAVNHLHCADLNRNRSPQCNDRHTVQNMCGTNDISLWPTLQDILKVI